MSDFLFHPGRVVATPPALATLAEGGHTPAEFLKRHISGDWGKLDTGDAKANDRAVRSGERILSSYETSTGDTVWIITDAIDRDVKRADTARRAVTTFLLPEDY
jgi:hypothetical protein